MMYAHMATYFGIACVYAHKAWEHWLAHHGLNLHDLELTVLYLLIAFLIWYHGRRKG